MNTFFKQNKMLVLVAVLIVIGIGYYAYSSSSSSSAPLLGTSDTAPTPEAAQLLSILSDLKTIQLNGAVFNDPAFRSLTDFGVVLTPESAGRRDPFAPVGLGTANATAAPGHK